MARLSHYKEESPSNTIGGYITWSPILQIASPNQSLNTTINQQLTDEFDERQAITESQSGKDPIALFKIMMYLLTSPI